MNRSCLLRSGALALLLALLVPVASAQHDRWTDYAPPVELEAKAAPGIDLPDVWREGALTFYTDRNTFFAANNGLPVEDFEDVDLAPDSGCGFPSPVDATTDNDCLDPGDLPLGITLAASGPFENEPNALFVDQGAPIGWPSIVLGPSFFSDGIELTFDPAVQAAGASTYGGFGGSPKIAEVFDTNGALLGAVTFTAQGESDAVFIGVSSDGPAIGSVLFRRVNPNTPNVVLDDIAFGTPTDCEQSLTAMLDDDDAAPGDLITFSVTVTNNGASPAPLDLWLDVRGPLGVNTIERRVLFESGTVPSGVTVTRSIPFSIPGNTPEGLYGLDLRIGDFESGEICDTELFNATVNSDQPIGRVHDTGVVQFEVFDDGRLGRISSIDEGVGFRFDNGNGLFESVVLVGWEPFAGAFQVSGQYFEGLDSEWATVSPIQAISPPVGFDEAYGVTFDDSAAPVPIGLEVTERSYSASGDAFVIVDLDITNTTGTSLEGIHVGIFADWDVPNFLDNLAGYDAGTKLLYVYDANGIPIDNYFGVAALDGTSGVTVSGLDYTSLTGFPPAGGNDADLYAALSGVDPPPTTPDDLRPVIGTGPYPIGAGETVNVKFAFVGGTSEADIIANAAAAQTAVSGAFASAPPAEASVAPAAVTPNPFARQATLSYLVDEPSEVRLTVYDVLGREVAVLADGPLEAGTHRATFDARGLAAGTYVWRLAIGDEVQTGRMTLLR